MQRKTIGAAAVILVLMGASYYLGTLHPRPAADVTDQPTAFLQHTAEPSPTENQAAEIVAAETATIEVTESAEPTAEAESIESGTIRVSEKDQMELVYIDAGEFLMGSADLDAQVSLDNGVAYPEVPLHSVYLDAYWIDRTEVTNSQYALCVADGACEPPRLNTDYLGVDYYPDPAFADYPVIYVSWYMAQDYCQWAGRRLPSEAEWEKAARGTDARRYPWGNSPISSELANFCNEGCPKDHANPNYSDGFPLTAPAGSFPAGASPYGVLDMAGNVWEWTSSQPRPYPYDAEDGREDEGGLQYIWRGGPWSNGTWWLRSSLRYRSVPYYWYNNLGFRCAVSAP